MKTKCKKLMSAAVVSAIIAAQTLMPVSAAGNTGKIESVISTKTPILRVQVPTSMAIAVDEFTSSGDDSQISSAEFAMENKSEIPVKVTVESTLDYDKTKVSLALTKASIEDSTKDEAWVAAVAMTADGIYKADGTSAGVDLAGTEDNVSTFGGSSKVKQSFYLKETTTSLKFIKGDGTDLPKQIKAADLGFAQAYKLTQQAAALSDQAALEALVAADDVYYINTTTFGTVADTNAIKLIEKGGTVVAADFNATYTYYTVADADKVGVVLGELGDAVKTDNSVYVYTDATAHADGKAGFRYIGALSGHKTGWSNEDLKKVTINYTITGLPTTVYTEAAANNGLKYGYKKDDTLTFADGVITAKIKVADFKDGTLKLGDVVGNLDTKAGAWGGGDDAVTFTLNQAWADVLKGQTFEVTVNLNSGDTTTAIFTMPAN